MTTHEHQPRPYYHSPTNLPQLSTVMIPGVHCSALAGRLFIPTAAPVATDHLAVPVDCRVSTKLPDLCENSQTTISQALLLASGHPLFTDVAAPADSMLISCLMATQLNDSSSSALTLTQTDHTAAHPQLEQSGLQLSNFHCRNYS